MHAAVLSAFPPGSEHETARVLWRLDRGVDKLTLYISSPRKPDLTHVVEQAGWPTAPDPWSSASLDHFLTGLQPGQAWRFRLTANPVHSVRQGDGLRGKRLAHVTASQQEEWFRTRCERWGFATRHVAITDRRVVTFGRGAPSQRRKVTLSMATYDGVLQVQDSASLSTALTAGLGRAKGYGCGLLTLAPLL